MKKRLFWILGITLLVISIYGYKYISPLSIDDLAEVNLKNSIVQFDHLLESALKSDRNPRTVNENGNLIFCHDGFDWTEGFFPGILWQLYNYSGEKKYENAANYFQNKFIESRFLTSNHDLGFVFNNSFGSGYRITGNSDHKQVMIDAANSLIERYNPVVKSLQSWDVDEGWQAKRGWLFPVIIDNMMNLELLFEVSDITGDSKYKEIAIAHANTSLENHFRPDFSTYHVVDFDPENGQVRSKETAQGYAHESSWARGQAWGLYGFITCYRYTKDEKYLRVAENIATFIFSNKNLPSDLIPYWDFNAPKIPNEPRDVSAAAIMASALIELDSYSNNSYLETAVKILRNLSSKKYKAELGSNNNFVLKHSVGSIPHNVEIDVPIIYADYYYIEALMRLNTKRN
jgi:unsaturated chondroitin disaccharide hydrolase